MKQLSIILLFITAFLSSCGSHADDDPYDELVTYDNWYRIGDDKLNKEFIRFNRTDFIWGQGNAAPMYNYKITEKGRIKYYLKFKDNPDTLYTNYFIQNGILQIFNGRTYERGK
ncbi:hypothetical protein CLV62_12518 [Dysgonomonas alginatilytica]|uniref:Lipoprotein n=1 Tax=Dysgonomonas alginatilytica TaxID=1605892 RepID=A0A2V3PK43_9BACT|nr:hypothetical protein [Dysgonomonas alginatilytica]PXV61185.1 hypothetical protein CLV62_12518 [Dysgonomonas alginatilytica]